MPTWVGIHVVHADPVESEENFPSCILCVYTPAAPVGGSVTVFPSGWLIVMVYRYLSVEGFGTCGLKNMKVTSWPTPTGLGVGTIYTYVGIWSCHLFQRSSLLADAL